MRYVIYGADTFGAPLVVEAASEEEARGRAAARGMAVRAVIAELPAEAPLSRADPGAPSEASAADSPELRGVQRVLRYVVLPLVVAFFLVLAVVRTLVEAAAWSVVWGLGLFLAAGVAGLLRWWSHGAVSVELAWPIGVVLGLSSASAGHGWQVGWRWWWAKRSLAPLAQVLGVAPEEADDVERGRLRLPVLVMQTCAGVLLGSAIALVGWSSDWSLLTVPAGIVGGALGLGVEGALLGAYLARHRPMLAPGANAGPSFESLAGLLGRLWGNEHITGSWVIGYALDRAATGAVAGTFTGTAAWLLGWWATAS